jgi:hypothetical protein
MLMETSFGKKDLQDKGKLLVVTFNKLWTVVMLCVPTRDRYWAVTIMPC